MNPFQALSTKHKIEKVATRPLLPQEWRPAGVDSISLPGREVERVIIPGYVPGVAAGQATLSGFLRIGRLYHPLCRKAFVERVQIGYYYYERREEWRTCALAAAYVGAFGPQSIERPEFSYSMAVWRLSQRVGFDIDSFQVIGPTGRHNNLADEMIALIDKNLWTRAGVAEWLESFGR